MRQIKFRSYNRSMGRMEYFGLGDTVPYYYKDENSPATKYEVMQFTGLLDKNGKEIYEGDIIDFENGYVTEIFWDRGGFRLDDLQIHDSLSHGIVIGNIYENLGLLVQQKT